MAVWLQDKVRLCGIGLWSRLNAGPVCDTAPMRRHMFNIHTGIYKNFRCPALRCRHRLWRMTTFQIVSLQTTNVGTRRCRVGCATHRRL